MTNPHPDNGLSTAAVLALAAMALGRIEEICYSSSRPTAGSRIVEIIGVITHFKILTTEDDQPHVNDPACEPVYAPPVNTQSGPPAGWGVQAGDGSWGPPPAPFAPRRPNAQPGPTAAADPITAVREPISVHYVPGPDGAVTDPHCQRCSTIHPIGTPCPAAGDTVVMTAQTLP